MFGANKTFGVRVKRIEKQNRKTTRIKINKLDGK